MNSINFYLLSTYLKKWSFNDNRITLNYSFCLDNEYERNHVDMRLSAPMNMVNDFLNNIFHRAKEKINEKALIDEDSSTNNLNNIFLVNEADIKRKLSIFINKILKEFNLNKRSRGRTRMISTRSLDFYYNDYEFEPLSDDIKFFVHLNRGVNKMSGDLWSNAIEDFGKALTIKPKDILANKYMAQANHKLGQHKEALIYIKIYAEAENTADSLDALASAYIHLNDFENAEVVYKEIESRFPESNTALYGRAQLAYKQDKGYKMLLDRIYKRAEDWLRDKLKTDWEYKIPGNAGNDDVMWNAATAARYLGYDRPFDLTRRAFNEELPSYFDQEKGTIRFVKEELDNWVEIMNRYKVDVEAYVTFGDRLTDQEKHKAELQKKAAKKNEHNRKIALEKAAAAELQPPAAEIIEEEEEIVTPEMLLAVAQDEPQPEVVLKKRGRKAKAENVIEIPATTRGRKKKTAENSVQPEVLAPEGEAAPLPRKRGRTKKQATPGIALPQTDTATTVRKRGRKSKKSEAEATVAPKKRGRAKKNISTEISTSEITRVTAVLKKGRPKKRTDVGTISSASNPTEQVRRKGRPKKNPVVATVPETDSSVAKRKRGRPKKSNIYKIQ